MMGKRHHLLLFLVWTCTITTCDCVPVLEDDTWDLGMPLDDAGGDDGRSYHVKTTRPLVVLCDENRLYTRRPPSSSGSGYILVRPSANDDRNPCVATKLPPKSTKRPSTRPPVAQVNEDDDEASNIAIWPPLGILLGQLTQDEQNMNGYNKWRTTTPRSNPYYRPSSIWTRPDESYNSMYNTHHQQIPVTETINSNYGNAADDDDFSWFVPNSQPSEFPSAIAAPDHRPSSGQYGGGGIEPHWNDISVDPIVNPVIEHHATTSSSSWSHIHPNLIFTTPSSQEGNTEIEVECGCDADLPEENNGGNTVHVHRITPRPITSRPLSIPTTTFTPAGVAHDDDHSSSLISKVTVDSFTPGSVRTTPDRQMQTLPQTPSTVPLTPRPHIHTFPARRSTTSKSSAITRGTEPPLLAFGHTTKRWPKPQTSIVTQTSISQNTPPRPKPIPNIKPGKATPRPKPSNGDDPAIVPTKRPRPWIFIRPTKRPTKPVKVNTPTKPAGITNFPLAGGNVQNVQLRPPSLWNLFFWSKHGFLLFMALAYLFTKNIQKIVPPIPEPYSNNALPSYHPPSVYSVYNSLPNVNTNHAYGNGHSNVHNANGYGNYPNTVSHSYAPASYSPNLNSLQNSYSNIYQPPPSQYVYNNIDNVAGSQISEVLSPPPDKDSMESEQLQYILNFINSHNSSSSGDYYNSKEIASKTSSYESFLIRRR